MQLAEPTANTPNQGQVLSPLVRRCPAWLCGVSLLGATLGVVLAQDQAEAPRQW